MLKNLKGPRFLWDLLWRRQPDLNWWIKVLQTSALPLGYGAINYIKMERVTRLELATSTLARWRSTRWTKPAYFNVVPPVGIEPTTRGFSVPCSTDWATEAHIWRPEWGSNPRPLAWQASVLTNWTTGPSVWWEQQGSNLWPSACKADALPAELCSHNSWQL